MEVERMILFQVAIPVAFALSAIYNPLGKRHSDARISIRNNRTAPRHETALSENNRTGNLAAGEAVREHVMHGFHPIDRGCVE
jgi:hypothetical protein